MIGAVAPLVEEKDEHELARRIAGGDEAAFTSLVERHHGLLLRLARAFVDSRAVAEEVVQETWLAVIDGIARFEGRSSLRTWLCRILSNRARTRAVRELRSVPVSSLDGDGGDGGGGGEGSSATRDRFGPVGLWQQPPRPWDVGPETAMLGREAAEVLGRALERLPAAQRGVVTLRDVEGWDAAEVCELLEISEANQRVLLHRGRTQLRAALEHYFVKE